MLIILAVQTLAIICTYIASYQHLPAVEYCHGQTFVPTPIAEILGIATYRYICKLLCSYIVRCIYMTINKMVCTWMLI